MTSRPHSLDQTLRELARRGIGLRAHGDRLRYWPRSAISPDLLASMKAHKEALIGLFPAANPIEPPAPAKRVAELFDAKLVDSRRVPARSGHDVRPLDQRGALAADTGDRHASSSDQHATTGPQPDGRYIATNPRRQPVIDLIRPVTRTDSARAQRLTEAWMERVAICEVEGGLTPEEAEAVALQELREKVSCKE